MAALRHHWWFRHAAPLAAVTLLGWLAAPAHAFFPPVPVYIPLPPANPAITVPPPPPTEIVSPPALPPVVVPPSVTPPADGIPPQSAPEPCTLISALLGGAGLSLFAACRWASGGASARRS